MSSSKVALVTGASSGMGLEWCKQLSDQGYQVILTARSLEKANLAASTLPGSGMIICKKMEVSLESDIKNLSDWVDENLGQMDLIINNAGTNPKDFSDPEKKAKAFELDKLDADVMLEVFRINSLAPLLVTKHFRRLLNKSEHPIVLNISSWLGLVSNLSFGGHYGYVGSKNLLNVLNKSMANELRPEGIIAVNVNPGWVKTEMGGVKAEFTKEQAVNNILKNVVDKISIENSGSFMNYDGSIYPW